MKKALALILALLMVFSLVACGGSTKDDPAKDQPKDEGKKEEVSGGTAAQPGADASVLEDGVSSGKLAGGLTTNDEYDINMDELSKDISIIIANETDISACAPFVAGAGRNQVRYLLYDNLALMKKPGGGVEDMDWVMAKDIVKIDNDTYEIEIYDYIHDSEGNHITASDVVFSYYELQASGASGKFSSHLESIEAIGEYKVRLVLKNNALGMAQYMLQFCHVVDEEAYKAQTEAQRAQSPIGTGAYKIKEFVAGGYVTLTRVEDYWQTDSSKWHYGNSGQIKEMKLIIMTEASQRSIGLENGSVDVVPNVAKDDVVNFMNVDGTAKDGYNVLKVLNSTTDFMLFNSSDKSICGDKNMRLAITYAIDRAGVMDGTYGKGGWLPSNETCTSVIDDYNEDWTWHEYDLTKSAEYLKAAGYKGEEIRIICESTPQNKTKAELIQAYLIAAGMKATINAYDSALMTEYKKDPTMWDLQLNAGGSSDYCLDTWNLIFPINGATGLNSCMLPDQTAVDLMNAAGGLDTHSKDTVNAMHDYLYENVFTMPFGTYYKYSAAHDNMLVWPLHPWNYLIFGGLIFK